MSKTPEEKPVVKENLTSKERAREYAIKRHGTHIAFEPDRFESRVAYLEGYHSRDEEVEAYREALKECIENIECVEANVNHSEGFFNALMNATVFCEQAKQLLKEEET